MRCHYSLDCRCARMFVCVSEYLHLFLRHDVLNVYYMPMMD